MVFCRSIRSFNRSSASITLARFSSLLIPVKVTSSFCNGDRSDAQSPRWSFERTVPARLTGVVCWLLGIVGGVDSSRGLSSCGAGAGVFCECGRLVGVLYPSSSTESKGSGGSGLSIQSGGRFLALSENDRPALACFCLLDDFRLVSLFSGCCDGTGFPFAVSGGLWTAVVAIVWCLLRGESDGLNTAHSDCQPSFNSLVQ